MDISIYNLEGKEKEKQKVSNDVFGLEINNDLIHQVYLAISGNKRQALAHTKTRGERSGSGKKPWKQKGTGRARVGSIRTPVWRKGGIVFGPRNDRNYSQKINKKMKIKAIKMVLTDKVKNKELFVLDSLDSFSRKKTKDFFSILKNLKIEGSVLWSFGKEKKDFRRCVNNIPKNSNILTEQLNVFDVLNSKYLIFDKDSLNYLDNKYKERKKE